VLRGMGVGGEKSGGGKGEGITLLLKKTQRGIERRVEGGILLDSRVCSMSLSSLSGKPKRNEGDLINAATPRTKPRREGGRFDRIELREKS